MSSAIAASHLHIDIERLHDHKIIIATASGQSGFGDTVCAIKVATLIHERLGIPVANIILNIASFDESIARFNEKYNFPHHPDISALRDIDIACYIIAPLNNTEKFCELKKKISKASPLLSLSEYNWGDPLPRLPASHEGFEAFKAARMGIIVSGEPTDKADERGILISEELKEWGLREDSTSSINRIFQLKKISPDLTRVILETETPEDAILMEFDASNRLYYGYSCYISTALSYVAAISKIDQMKDPIKNPTLILPIKIISFTDQVGKETYLGLLKYLREQNYGNLIVKSTANKILESVKFSESPKTITLIIGPISYSDSLTLWKCSEDETITTGDQSLSEAISCIRKRYGYEALLHKTALSIGLSQAYIKFSAEPAPTFGFGAFESPFPEMADRLASLYSDPSKALAFTNFNRSIIEEQDCSNFIVDEVSKMLSSHFTESIK